MTQANNKWILIALFISVFTIGTSEYVIMGILPVIATDLSITIPTAGLLVTGYALGVAIGSPLVTAMTGQHSRKKLLVGLMIFFTLSNVMAALSFSFGFLMTARILSSLIHGTFFAVATVIASQTAPKDKQGSAIATVAAGLTLSTVLGVPLGTFIAHAWGWQTTFWVVTALGIVASFLLILHIPSKIQFQYQSLKSELGAFKNPQIILILLVTIFGYGGVFASYTYIAPQLETFAGFSAEAIATLLFMFGIGSFLGTITAGKLANRSLMPTLIMTLLLLIVILTLFTWTVHDKTLASVTVFIFGFTAFATTPLLQTKIVQTAKEAPTLAAAVNISAFNLANAVGAYLGGETIRAGFEMSSVNLTGAIITAIGLVFSIILLIYGRKLSKTTR
ncbi:MFS transporter (plasmid) [Mammaliicoccus sciuri]|uniref:MFS transporter n=1 Tax=Mammaliicoccus sciuri TaxID=1296 RepID=UPI002DBCD4DC|nr:MFS transporter [Mammaliicoccus sciuri]MEB5648588.1 MFS transporter [Mammaliicoccus sciuri]